MSSESSGSPVSRRRVCPAETRTEMTWIVMPGHTNNHGTVFGGQVAAWIDVCAAVSAQRFCRGAVVTVAMDDLLFRAPIRRGHVAVLQAQVNRAWRTSMEVGVRVEGEDPLTGERVHTSTAYLTFVALDEDGRPTPLPTLDLRTEDDARRAEQAALRRARRLEVKSLGRPEKQP